MEVAKHKTVNHAVTTPAAAAHADVGKLRPGAGGMVQLPSPSTRRFAESGILGKSEVTKFLAMRGEPVRVRGRNKLRTLSEHEQHHDNAATKLEQTGKAVVIPLSEEQSKSNAGQVGALDGRHLFRQNQGEARTAECPGENILKPLGRSIISKRLTRQERWWRCALCSTGR